MSHPLAGQTVRLRGSTQWSEGTEYRVEDSADGILEHNIGNPARLFGMLRFRQDNIPYDPSDPEVLYGKIGNLGYMVHSSEILTEPPE